MDLTRLRSLRELARRGSIAAVAEALHLTPSAVSQQIGQLEEEAGVALTERRGRGLRLTAAGLLLARHADDVLAVLDTARSGLAALRGEVAGEVRLAAFPSAAAALLPRALQALRSSHPRLEPIVQELEPAEALAALASWQVDLAIVDDLALAAGTHPRIVCAPLADDVLCALLPARHPLAGAKSIAIGELAAERWAMDSSSSAYGDFVTGLCRQAGFEPRINAHCRGFEMVASFVAAGCSVSVIPGLRRGRPLRGTAMVELRPRVRRQVVLAHRHEGRDHPALRAVMAALEAG